MKTHDKKLSEEFGDFLDANEIDPPKVASEYILSRIHDDLNPSQQRVFIKVLSIHILVSFFTLSFCSQFGIRTLPVFDLMFSMMNLVGERYCMAFCGLFYIGSSALFLSFILRPEEIAVIRKNRIFKLTLLTGVSLGILISFGATVLLVPGILWFTGCLIGGFLSFELGWLARSKLRNQLIFGT